MFNLYCRFQNENFTDCIWVMLSVTSTVCGLFWRFRKVMQCLISNSSSLHCRFQRLNIVSSCHVFIIYISLIIQFTALKPTDFMLYFKHSGMHSDNLLLFVISCLYHSYRQWLSVIASNIIFTKLFCMKNWCAEPRDSTIDINSIYTIFYFSLNSQTKNNRFHMWNQNHL